MCNHKLNKRKVNIIADLPNPELIELWNVRTGDYNDVYENKEVRATRTQIDQYIKEYFSPQQMRYIEEFGDNISFGYELYYPNGDVKYYSEAIKDEFPIAAYKEYVDLTKESD